MKVLLDTSVLVAGMVEAHPYHEQGFTWLKLAAEGEVEGLVAAHSLAELYAVLTTLPVHPRISGTDAAYLIQRDVGEHLEIVSLDGREYTEMIEHLAASGIIGGVTYDAIILQAGRKAEVDLVLTFNVKDFRRIYPGMADKVASPNDVA